MNIQREKNMVSMSRGKYIFFSSVTLVVGALVVGIPLLSNSSKYYNEAEQTQTVIQKKQTEIDDLTTTAGYKDSRISYLESELNRVKRDKNNLLYAVTMSSAGKMPSGWNYETCEYGFETVAQCR